MVFVTVVPRSSCCGSSSAGECFVFLCNAASIALDLQKLIGALSYPSPVKSTACSSWSPQLADSLTEAVVRAIGNSIPAIISSIQRNASSQASSSVPGVSASGAPQPLFSSASASSASTSDVRCFFGGFRYVYPSRVCSYVYASAGHYRLELGPPRGSYSLHFRIARRY